MHPQDERHHLDAGHVFQLIPDLVYDRPGRDGFPVSTAVIDAKYVIETGSSAHRDHVYQVLAYCVAIRARRGYIVYAEGPAEPSVHRMQGTGIEIVRYPLDLSQLWTYSSKSRACRRASRRLLTRPNRIRRHTLHGLRRPLVPLDEHDAALLKKRLAPLLDPAGRHLDAYQQIAAKRRARALSAP